MAILKSIFSRIEKPSKRFYQYFIYYLTLIVLIILIISGVVYKNFVSVLQQEADRSNYLALNKAAETMDTRIMELNNLAMMISKNQLLYDNLLIADGFGQGECVKELAKYTASNMFIYDILLYFNGNDTKKNKIYTTTSSFSPEFLFDSVYKYKEWGQQEFHDIFNHKAIPYMRPVDTVSVYNFEKIDLFTYIFPLPINSNNPKSSVIFLIKASDFKNILSDVLKNYDGYVYVLNEKAQPIYYENCGLSEGRSLEILDEVSSACKSGIEKIKINEKQFSISKTVSNYNRWTYISVMNSSQLFYKVSKIKRIFIMTIIIVFLLGIIVAVVFATRQYKLLKILANSIKGKVCHFNTPESGPKDEIKIISQGIEYMSHENSKLTMQLQSNMKAIKDGIMLSLLKSEKTDTYAENETFEMLGVKLDGESYIVSIIFAIDNYKDYKSKYSRSDIKTLAFNIIKVLEQLAEKTGQGYEDYANGKYTQNETSHFIDCIQKGIRPLTGGPESVQGLRVIWRLYEAEKKNVVADLRGLGFDDPWEQPGLNLLPQERHY